jgi:hypothetical protein
MLSLARCRTLLPTEAKDWSDAQVEALRDQLYVLAGVLLDDARRTGAAGSSMNTALPLVPSEHRPDLEERAAILEFDAGLSRDDAERTALTSYVFSRRS